MVFYYYHRCHKIRTFFTKVCQELLATISMYGTIIRHPSLLIFGTYQVIYDIFYELPRSFICKQTNKNIKTQLKENASQALIISEVVTIPGNYI